jgi:hypothetical protein
MSQSLQEFLSALCDDRRKVADETISCLGEDTAGLFIYLYNDALDILTAILAAYPEEERFHSLVFAEFTGLLNELTSLQMHFLGGNYRLVRSQLRYNWERIFRAGFADAYAEENPHAVDGLADT